MQKSVHTIHSSSSAPIGVDVTKAPRSPLPWKKLRNDHGTRVKVGRGEAWAKVLRLGDKAGQQGDLEN